MFSCIAKTFYGKIGFEDFIWTMRFSSKSVLVPFIYIYICLIFFSLVFEWKITEIYSIQKTRRNFNSNWSINPQTWKVKIVYNARVTFCIFSVAVMLSHAVWPLDPNVSAKHLQYFPYNGLYNKFIDSTLFDN